MAMLDHGTVVTRVFYQPDQVDWRSATTVCRGGPRLLVATTMAPCSHHLLRNGIRCKRVLAMSFAFLPMNCTCITLVVATKPSPWVPAVLLDFVCVLDVRNRWTMVEVGSRTIPIVWIMMERKDSSPRGHALLSIVTRIGPCFIMPLMARNGASLELPVPIKEILGLVRALYSRVARARRILILRALARGLSHHGAMASS
mmetsp:Transcript_16482/g.29959  ORF Transcript_16482/g.29959 Transcript_16482/m.29959 type:complete len:200 (-) Transcript_16482:355-954(-)